MTTTEKPENTPVWNDMLGEYTDPETVIAEIVEGVDRDPGHVPTSLDDAQDAPA